MSVRKFNVYGMSCAACAARIEKAVKAVEGVTECSVSLLTNTMGVQGSAEDAVIEQAVKNAGYEASSFSVKKTVLKENKSVEKSETQNLLRRLLFSLFFLLCLMYCGMGNRMYGLPLPAWFSGNFTAIALVQLFLCSVILIINRTKSAFLMGLNNPLSMY